MNKLIKNNILNDNKLIKLIKDNFTEDDIKIFELNYEIYKNYKENKNEFTIDLADIYEFIGFTQKINAKRLLIKNFIKDNDYKILLFPNEEQKLDHRGGHNKEKILLNIDCYKEFCLLAATQQSKKIYKYFIKMEKIIFEYMEEQLQRSSSIKHNLEEQNKIKNDIIEEKNKIFKNETNKMKSLMELQKHNAYIEAFKNRYVIYIAKIRDQDNKIIIKIGSTKEIQVRAQTLTEQYKTFCIIKIFECPRNEEFEKFLHKHQNIKIYKYNVGDFINSHEIFLVSDKELDNVIEIAKRNKFKFSSLVDNEKLIELENIKLKQMEEQTKQIELQHNENNKIDNYVDPIILLSDHRNHTQVRGDKIQRYSADSKTLLKTYECYADALRDNSLSASMSISRTSIKNAIDKKLIYKGYRWAKLSRELDDYTIQDIGETIESKTVKIGYVAMLNLNKDEIVKVFPDQKACMEDRHLTSSASVANAIKRQSVCSGHYVMMWDNCPTELKNKYLENNTLPDKRVNGIQIQQLHPINNIVIKVYSSVEDVIKEYKISRKTLKSAYEFNIICKGYKWKKI